MAFHRANRSHLPSLGVKGHNAWSQRYWTLWTGERIYDWKDLCINASESLSVSEHFFDPLKLKQKTLLCISFDSDAKVWNKTPVCFLKNIYIGASFILSCVFSFSFFLCVWKCFRGFFFWCLLCVEEEGWKKRRKRRGCRRVEVNRRNKVWRGQHYHSLATRYLRLPWRLG